MISTRPLAGPTCSSLLATLLSTLLSSVLSTAPAVAQEPPEDAWSWKWKNGFELTSPDGAIDLGFGGRLQADYTLTDSDDFDLEDGFEFRRARLFFAGTVYERVELKAEYDFAGGDAAFKDAYVGLVMDWGRIRFGHFHEPFSLEELTSSKYITFVERSLPVEAFSPSRQSGIGVLGATDTFTWGAGAFYSADDFGDSVSEDDTDLTARLVYRPLGVADDLVHLGLSATHQERGGTMRFRSRPEAHLAPRLVDTGSFAGDGADIVDLELAAIFGPFWAAGEWMQADVDAAGDPTFDGFYVAAGWFLTGERRAYKAATGSFDRVKPRASWDGDGGAGAWEVALRYSRLDLTDAGIVGGELEDVTVALNWYLNPVTRLMLDLVHADREGAGEANLLVLRWAIDF